MTDREIGYAWGYYCALKDVETQMLIYSENPDAVKDWVQGMVALKEKHPVLGDSE